jgi:hypothetical protein
MTIANPPISQNWKKKKATLDQSPQCYFFSGAPLLLTRLSESLHTTNTKQSSLIRHNFYLENVFYVFWRKFVLTPPL